MQIARRDHFIIAILRHIYLCVAVCAHLVCNEFNATTTENVQKHPLIFAMNRTYRTFSL